VATACLAPPDTKPPRSCELVVLDENGHPRFQWMHRARRPAATLVAFDVLRDAGCSVVSRPLELRRSILETLVPYDRALLLRSTAFNDGHALLAQCEALQLEGIVAKRLGSRYRPGRRTNDWLKIRTEHGQQVIQRRMENAHG
jgi:bifunctional non-homologous end joining protein LigD